MHRVYYMLSTGKKSLMIGMIELYAFVTALEKDWVQVRRGIPISYGSLPPKQVNVSHSIGWNKATKRQKAAWNDGRAPDTTEQLLANAKNLPKRAKLGRPKNSPNINRDPQSTYVSYVASKDRLARNQCWLAAALESLYAVYSPLWLQEPGGKQTDLFFLLVSHFTTRTTYEMKEGAQVRSILTRGSNKLFMEAQKLYPANFISGAFASCDLFLEIVLDPKRNKSKTLPKLFRVQEDRIFSCPLHPGAQEHPRGSRDLGVLSVTKSMFESNNINCANVAELFSQWTTTGLVGVSGLQCRQCKQENSQIQLPAITSNLLHEKSIISVINSTPRPHFNFAGEEYTAVSRGFWGDLHYWGKVLRYVNGVTAVWMHDDRANGGFAQLVDRTPGSISGAQPHTSWMIYSRQWTPNEKAFIDTSIANIQRDNPVVKADNIPFVNMGAVLQDTFDSALPHLTQGQAADPNPTMTITQLNGESGPQDGNNREKPVNSTGEGLKICIRRIDKKAASNPLNSVSTSAPSVSSKELMSAAPPGSTNLPTESLPSLRLGSELPFLDVKSKKTTGKCGRPKARKLASKTFIPKPLTDADWACISNTYWNNRRLEKEELASNSKPVAVIGLSTIQGDSQAPEIPQLHSPHGARTGSQALRRSSRKRGAR
ncbi:uncharacterized protein PGTG_21047 [Puccinia graminis f. sp. tritici CRL 75-36-700-3]|uniref:Uncharacterized protein n=1 Tax=Puccinia graminis f. sp. tritici (strain CRL 75-36-700-3 / race SCCL) TaxID=418459 RepID=H6QQ77_PUCGT|nr:uncharacterized protein PGTG_21047 [Puccinia graminis f. sp. tritici CRL 75-36-700-3]EHS64787.1 hypothetical protein PGTG_21047 [Puccinia graminis f. sp. tritici CRL 75-36-700-3]